MKKKIGVLISGGGSNLQSLINACNRREINGEIKIVISNRRKAFGLERAEKNGIKNIFISKKESGSNEN